MEFYPFKKEYQTETGEILNCSDLSPRDSNVSASSLSLLLSQPAYYGSFLPEPLWTGVQFSPQRMQWTPSFERSAKNADIAQLFHETIKGLTANACAIGVAFSGGLDSTAVLAAAAHIAKERKIPIVALTAIQETDRGRIISDYVTSLRKAIGAEISHIISDSQELPYWKAEGPCLQAMPWSTAGQARDAREHGVDVILTGCGADEALAAPRYLTSYFLRRDWAALHSYWRLVVENGVYGPICETASLFAGFSWKELKAKAYMASNYFVMGEHSPQNVLSDTFSGHVRDWSKRYYRSLFDHHLESSQCWSVADAYDTLMPIDLPITSHEFPEVHHPFLANPFLEAAISLPLDTRFDHRQTTAYHRRKALIKKLIPQELDPYLPKAKETFRNSILGQHNPDVSEPTALIDSGIVDADRWNANRHAEFIPYLFSIERWLRGALERGFYVA